MKKTQTKNTVVTTLSTKQLAAVTGGYASVAPAYGPEDMKAEAGRPAHLTRLF